MKVITPVVELHQFSASDFIAGDAALDFVNTVTGRDRQPRDWLDSYARLLEWAALAQLLPDRNLRALRRASQSEPSAAARALARAKALREELFELLATIISGRAPRKDALAALRKQWLRGIDAHDLRFRDGRVIAEVRGDPVDFDLIPSIVAYRIVECVMPLPPERLRICHGVNCSWLFIDSSKAGRRRWCDMAVCGNAAKSQRFRARSGRRRRP